MNGVHDIGGMHGMGPIPIEKDAPVFHHHWEERTFAMFVAMGMWRKWNIDAGRLERESIPAPLYFNFSYYERWLETLFRLIRRSGLASEEELRTGKPEIGAQKKTPPLVGAKVPDVLTRIADIRRSVDEAPMFKTGDEVRARNINPTGHTRLPRYVRAKKGTVIASRGAYVFPDTNAEFKGECPQYLYCVRFMAREVWGPETAPGDAIQIDLWESYLEPVSNV